MWKKPVPENVSVSASERSEPTRRPAKAAGTATTAPARIGSSLVIKGELYGEEDLVVDGKVDGSITVKSGSVTVGAKGSVEADIRAASIEIAGRVKGNLSGADKVVLMESGRVEGNITAKSVTLENGCRFKGSIDMESGGAGPVSELAATTTTRSGPKQATGGSHGPIRTP